LVNFNFDLKIFFCLLYVLQEGWIRQSLSGYPKSWH
jgi:hypothetical protein